MIAPLSIPSPNPDIATFNVGPFTIHMYALCIIAGTIAATILTSRRLTKRGAEPGIVLDIILWAIPLGIIGARIFHVLTHPGDYFYPGADLLRTLYIWEGGIAIFGSLLGGAVGAFIGCRMTGIRFWTFADALAPGLLLAQAFGRLGNYFNHELYGLPTDLPWGLEIEASNPAFPIGLPAGTLFHPTFLYEIIWNLLGVAVILWIGHRFNPQWGRLFGVYLIWYGAGRTVWETIRTDPSEYLFGIRANVWAAILAIVVGLAIIVIQSRRHTGAEPSPYVPGRSWADPKAAVDYYDTDAENLGLRGASTDDEADGSTSAASSTPTPEATVATSKTGSRS